MHYPVEKPSDWDSFGKLGLYKRLKFAVRERRNPRPTMQDKDVTLTAIHRASGTLPASGVVAIFSVRNGEVRLPSLLAHYRRLGVARFAVVDDRSHDRSRRILSEADDVDLYESNVGFVDSMRSLIWRDMLLEIYGRNRWYVGIDSDEYLVFPGFEERPLSAFIADLKRNGLTRALGPMIDIYPDGRLSDAPPHLPPEAPPTEFSPLFDRDGYSVKDERFCTAVRGGLRLRRYGADMHMTKFPVFYADRRTSFAAATHHGPTPLRRNFCAVHCLLLHYKFPIGAAEELKVYAERGVHSNDAFDYKRIVASQAFGEDADLRYSGSLRYRDSEQMIELGFMQDLREK